jgi:hypothetical protein
MPSGSGVTRIIVGKGSSGSGRRRFAKKSLPEFSTAGTGREELDERTRC